MIPNTPDPRKNFLDTTIKFSAHSQKNMGRFGDLFLFPRSHRRSLFFIANMVSPMDAKNFPPAPFLFPEFFPLNIEPTLPTKSIAVLNLLSPRDFFQYIKFSGPDIFGATETRANRLAVSRKSMARATTKEGRFVHGWTCHLRQQRLHRTHKSQCAKNALWSYADNVCARGGTNTHLQRNEPHGIFVSREVRTPGSPTWRVTPHLCEKPFMRKGLLA